MLRRIYFRNTKTGDELQMPVTPPGFQIEIGRSIENIDMAGTGEINLPGLEALFNEQIEFLLPAESRPYAASGWGGDPYAVVSKLQKWSLDGDVLRFIVSGTPVNYPVLLGPVASYENDGTNDVTVKLTLRQYRYLKAETTETVATGNRGRPTDNTASAMKSYTVVSGDCMWNIARKYYGDGALCWKLATYNGIANASLIFPGQKLKIPDKGQL